MVSATRRPAKLVNNEIRGLVISGIAQSVSIYIFSIYLVSIFLPGVVSFLYAVLASLSSCKDGRRFLRQTASVKRECTKESPLPTSAGAIGLQLSCRTGHITFMVSLNERKKLSAPLTNPGRLKFRSLCLTHESRFHSFVPRCHQITEPTDIAS